MKFYTRKRRIPAVIIVPMVDILAILLIFVIVTTTFRREQPEIIIKLPESKSAEAAATTSEPSILSVTPDGKVSFQGKSYDAGTVAQLGATLKEYRKNSPDGAVALQADTKAPFGTIISVIDALKDAGFPTLPAFMEKKEQ